MPLLINEKNETNHLLVWRLDEDETFFHDKVSLSGSEQAQLSKLKFQARKREFLCVRMLIQEFIGKSVQVLYSNDGRPVLKGSDLNLSISHSKSHVGIFICKHGSPGLDIEQISSRVGKIYHKFVGETEKIFVNIADEKVLTLIWSAKESMFKMICEPGIDFRNNLSVEMFNPAQTGTLTGQFIKDSRKFTLSLKYRLLDENAIVWGIHS